MKHSLQVRKSVPDGVVLFCQLGGIPLQLYWQQMLPKYVSRLSELLSDRLVKKPFNSCLICKQVLVAKRSLWLSQHGFEGVLAEGTISLANAEQHLRQTVPRYLPIFSEQRSAFSWPICFLTPMSWPLTFMTLDPVLQCFALIKFRLGGHSLRIETDRWLRHKSYREQRVCRHHFFTNTHMHTHNLAHVCKNSHRQDSASTVMSAGA